MTHICVIDLTSIVSDNGLSPGRRQAIIRTNAGIFLIRPLGTNFREIVIEISNIFIQENAFESVVFETAAILSRPQCANIDYVACYNKSTSKTNETKAMLSKQKNISLYKFMQRVGWGNNPTDVLS